MLAALRLGALGAVVAAAPVVLNPATADHVYDGHGALSAGASSRLLWDYPEPQRSQILDYMFKPNFGASLHMLKVEIGGDAQSTDGSEPSPQHTRNEPTQCNRGYESWLLQEASKRNPSIQTYGLSWAVPHWIGNGSFFTQDNIAYQTSWASCVTALTGKPLDFIGIWNERSWGTPSYVTSLRQSLDSAGLSHTQIILPDGGGGEVAGIVSAAQGDATFAAAVTGVGLHYPCNSPAPAVDAMGWKFWASEDYSTVADWAGAGCWGASLVRNYVRMNMTSTISWSLIWSVYPSLPYFGNGLMYAMEPWSGHYSGGGHTPGVDPSGDIMNGPLWTSAHFTQFTKVGWKFLSVPGGGSGSLPGGGYYATLVPPSAGGSVSDFSLILTTLEGDCLRCKGSPTTAQTLTYQVAQGMPGPGTVLYVWQTTELAQFVSMPSLTIAADGTFSVSIPQDAMLTVTTLNTGMKGSFPGSPVPPSAPFPVPYSDSFDPSDYPYDVLPKYFSDQAGSFAVRNGTLQQVVPIDPGSDAWVTDPDPITLIGGSRGGDAGPVDPGWGNYSVAVTVTFEPNAPSSSSSAGVQRMARAARSSKRAGRSALKRYSRVGQQEVEKDGDGNPAAALAPCNPVDTHQKWALNTPANGYLSNAPYNSTDAQLCLNLDGCEQAAIYYQCVTSGGTCCGDSCYAGLQWMLPSAGGGPRPIQSPLGTVSGDCLTVMPDGSISMQKCGAYGNQSWAYSRGGLVQLAGYTTPAAPQGLCLVSPPSVPSVYTKVCGRITGFSGFTKEATTGYCAALDVEGNWYLRAGSKVLGNGSLSVAASGYNPATTPITITLAMKGSNITATFTPPAPAQPSTFTASNDLTYSAGMAGVGSGYHPAAFDDFALTPL